MLEIMRKYPRTEAYQEIKPKDIIVTKYEEEVTYEGNCTLIKKIKKQTNLTKLINETKKLVKLSNAEEKLQQLEKIFTNKER